MEQAQATPGIATTADVVALVAIGYPGSGEQLDERTRAKDARPRERLPIERIVYYAERWGASLPAGEAPTAVCPAPAASNRS